MQDIFKSVDENMNDARALVDNYNKINEDINRLFDTRVLPLPEDYITNKNKLDIHKYK